MTEIEQGVGWTSPQDLKDEVVYSLDYGGRPLVKDNAFDLDDLDKIPMIVIESNQQSENSDAPIVIFPSDGSIVGAEEVVTEAQCSDITWSGMVEKEEVIAGAVADGIDSDDGQKDDSGEIPLNDQSYATYHPFPCDFCCRRFKKKANLINHMVAHQTQRPHSCNICSSRFMRKCDLVNHQKIHAYVPNRDNRDDLDTDSSLPTILRNRPGRTRRRSSGSGRQSARTKAIGTFSPPSSPDYNLKSSSYVDEDVKLLLEMTNKLHESRQSEDGEESSTPAAQKAVSSNAVEGKPYVCATCGRCFARESALVSHTQIHAEDLTYDCNKCGSRYFTSEQLREHYAKKHNSVYSGDTSDSSADEGGASKGLYTGDERFGTFYCPICAISFHRLDLLKQHKKIHSRRDDLNGIYRCVTCQSMFLTSEKLLEHLDSSINCQKNVCLLCGDQFSSQSQVQNHIQAKHPKIPPNTCTYCGKQCRDPKMLKRHYWVHVSDKRQLSLLDERMLTCDECDQEFMDKRSLLNHRHTHFTANNQRRFVCNECGKSFGSRSSQQIHNRIHTGERPYGCRYCWKAFADGGTLRKHERIHTGEKPYVCAVCPRAFNQRVVLREHIRSHHSGSINKMGYSIPVYMCPVCGVITGGSDELALHIVKHCDDNTVRNRTPTTGVRSYKRRKKSDSNRDTLFYKNIPEFDEADFFDSQNNDTDYEIKLTPPKRNSRNLRSSYRYGKTTKTPESPVKIASPPVEPVRKAKMINTKPVPTGGRLKKGPKKRGRRIADISSVVTVVKPRVRTLSGRLSGRGDIAGEDCIASPEESPEKSDMVDGGLFGRPRTKNVNYETLRSLRKGITPATFPDKSPGSEDSVGVKSEEMAMSSHVKSEIIEYDSDEYACSVCNMSFPSKSDLLDHVPIHI